MNKNLWLLGLLLLTACSQEPASEVAVETNLESAAQLTLQAGSGDPACGVLTTTCSRTFKIRNTGDAPSEIPTPTLVGMNAADFTIIQATNCAAPLPKNKDCTVRVNFNPAGKSAGPYIATLQLGATPSFTLNLSATVPQPPGDGLAVYDGAVQLTSAGLNFGNLQGSQQVDRVLTIKNISGKNSQPLDVGLTNDSFVLVGNTCQNKILLTSGANSSCTVQIRFTTYGKSSQVYLSDLLFNGNTLALTGSVLEPFPMDDPNSGVIIETYVNNEALTAEDLSLGILPSNQGIVKVITFKNVGTAVSTPMTAALSENGNFYIISNQCYERILGPQASCSFRLVFSAVGKNAGSYNVGLQFPGVELPIVSDVLPTPDCGETMHLETPVCVDNLQPCAYENGTGQKAWNGVDAYGSCYAIACNEGYDLLDQQCLVACAANEHRHPTSHVCEANVIDCTNEIAHAANATRTWSGSDYGSCQVNACENHYQIAGNACSQTIYTVQVQKAAGMGTISDGNSILCDADCTQGSYPIASGTNLTFEVLAAEGREFDAWGDDCSDSVANPICQLTVDGNKTISATFSLMQYLLTLSPDVGGTILGASAGLKDYNTLIELTPNPAPGYEFTGWAGACSGTGTCSFSMTENREVIAHFQSTAPTLAVTLHGNGSVVSNVGGINCGSTCSQEISVGANVILTATPALNQFFIGWNNCPALEGLTCVINNFQNSLNIEAIFASSNPINGSENVNLDTDVAIDFNVPMNSASVVNNFVLKDENGQAVAGEVNYADGVATFAPNQDLLNDQVYSFEVGMAAQQANSQNLIQKLVGYFMTAMTRAYTSFFEISSPTYVQQQQQSVGIAPNGDVAVAYRNAANIEGLVRIYNHETQTWSAPTQIAETGLPAGSYPQQFHVAGDANGNFMIAWNRGNPSTNLSRYYSKANGWGSIQSLPAGHARKTMVANTQGDFLIPPSPLTNPIQVWRKSTGTWGSISGVLDTTPCGPSNAYSWSNPTSYGVWGIPQVLMENDFAHLAMIERCGATFANQPYIYRISMLKVDLANLSIVSRKTVYSHQGTVSSSSVEPTRLFLPYIFRDKNGKMTVFVSERDATSGGYYPQNSGGTTIYYNTGYSGSGGANRFVISKENDLGNFEATNVAASVGLPPYTGTTFSGPINYLVMGGGKTSFDKQGYGIVGLIAIGTNGPTFQNPTLLQYNIYDPDTGLSPRITQPLANASLEYSGSGGNKDFSTINLLNIGTKQFNLVWYNGGTYLGSRYTPGAGFKPVETITSGIVGSNPVSDYETVPKCSSSGACIFYWLHAPNAGQPSSTYLRGLFFK